jgi:hypothetical protein
VKVSVEIGDSLCVRFDVPDTDERLRLYARVVNVMTATEGRHLCVKFVDLSEHERGTLLRYAFREQIRRAKGESGSSRSISGRGHNEADH